MGSGIFGGIPCLLYTSFWWMTILRLVGDHPLVGGGPSYVSMVGVHPWQLSPSVNFLTKVLVPNSKSVGHLLLVVDHPWVGG